MAIDKEKLKDRHSEEADELRRQIKEKETILQNYRKDHGKLKVFFDDVIREIKPIKQPEPVNLHQKPGAPVVPVMHITDGHMGARQEPNEIEGFNSFSAEIADQRNEKFAHSFIKWVNIHRKVYNISECAILMTGDLISGDIHDELRITNEFPVPVQVVRAAQSHARQISIVARYFKKVIIHFITEDNHSRLTKRPQAKEAGYNSLNYLVGHMIESYIRDLDNIEMNIYPMLGKVVNVNGRQYLICHGHNVRGWMGVPWYGIERKVGKESQARLQLIMQDLERAKDIGFDKYVHGHFHTPFDSILYSCGASVQGTDAYDHQAGRYAPPGQSAWMVHAKKGEFNRINFWL